MSHEGVSDYTIDELARVTGVTVRNIRAHQSRGLLPPPEVRGRTGFYGPEHVARLRLVVEMQADGFNLSAIKRIFDGMPPGSAGHVLGFEEALRQPWTEEAPEIVEEAELIDRLGGGKPNMDRARRAARLGLFLPLGGGRYEVPSPTLMRAGEELARLGVSPSAALDALEQLNRHAEGVSKTFIRLFLEQIWKPFDRAGRPEQDWPRIRESLERMRPLAVDSLVATFQRIMGDAVEEEMTRAVMQQSKGKPAAPPERAHPKPVRAKRAARSRKQAEAGR
jgi:DNA-binding transcriptional MerR regulator